MLSSSRKPLSKRCKPISNSRKTVCNRCKTVSSSRKMLSKPCKQIETTGREQGAWGMGHTTRNNYNLFLSASMRSRLRRKWQSVIEPTTTITSREQRAWGMERNPKPTTRNNNDNLQPTTFLHEIKIIRCTTCEPPKN